MDQELIQQERTKKLWFLVFYSLVFFVIWTFCELLLKTKLAAIDPYLNLLLKLLLWTLPVWLILKYWDHTEPLKYLKLKENFLQGIIWGVTLSGVLILYILFRDLVLLKKAFCPRIDQYTLLSAVILIGFTEEVVFRGFLLQKLNELMKFWNANLISSGLFLVIHFPKWYHEGLFFKPSIYGSIIFIFCFGVLEGYVLKRSKSLWACMLIHSINNLMTMAFK